LTGKYTKYKPEFRDEIAKLIVESNRPIAGSTDVSMGRVSGGASR
jgi:hypothetical protein